MLWRWHKRSQNDFRAELQAHIELEADCLSEEGLSGDEARAQAHRSFGNLTQAEERFYESQRILWMDNLVRDTTYALRQLTKNKLFAFVAAGTLAIGIASTTVIFTLIQATLLRPLPYPSADRIIAVKDIQVQGQSTGGLMSVARFFDLRQAASSFESLSLYYFQSVTMTSRSSLPVPLNAAVVSGDFWKVFKIPPSLGRTFGEADDRPGMPRVAVIDYATWQQLFGGQRSILNQQVAIDGNPTTIIGIMPSQFDYPPRSDVWLPSRFDPSQWQERGNGTRFVNVIGRLKNKTTLLAAEQQLQLIGQRLQRQYPDTDGKWAFNGELLSDFLFGSIKGALVLLMAAAVLLLLIACINVANLQLSRTTARIHEVVLRHVLGASRARLLGQFLTEGIVLSLIGAAIGCLCALATTYLLKTRLPEKLEYAAATFNWSSLIFVLAVSLATGIAFGLVPVMRHLKGSLDWTLRQSELRVAKTGGGAFRSTFISLEVGLSLLLLIGASLLGESLWNLIKKPLGFQPDRVLTFQIKLPWKNNPNWIRSFYDELQRRIESLPGIVAVGQISALPTDDWHLRSNFGVDWRPHSVNNNTVNVEDRHIAGRYIEAMRIRLITGRTFTPADRKARRPVVLVNEAFAKEYMPNGQLCGHHLINKMATFEIVGIVGDVRGTGGSIAKPEGPVVYFPATGEVLSRAFVVRSRLPSEQLIRTIRNQVYQLDPTQAIRKIATLNDRINRSISQPRFNTALVAVFALIALLLACVGVYGIVAFSVTQRSIEIGIRMALGATPLNICWLFLWRAMVPTVIGLSFGGIVALMLSRFLRSQLYGVAPEDPTAFGIAVSALLVSVFLASIQPALHAATMNPTEALREE